MICLRISKLVKLIQRLIFGIPCVLTTKFDVLNRHGNVGLSVPSNGTEALSVDRQNDLRRDKFRIFSYIRTSLQV